MSQFLPYKTFGEDITVDWVFSNPDDNTTLTINDGEWIASRNSNWSPESGIKIAARVKSVKPWSKIVTDVVGPKGRTKFFLEMLSPGNGIRRMLESFTPIGNERLEAEISGTIRRADICNNISARLLAVASTIDTSDKLATNKIGTILFESRSHDISIIGNRSRINTVVDSNFDETLPKIWWELNFDDPMYESFSAGIGNSTPVVIHLNSPEPIDIWGGRLDPDIRNHLADFVVDTMLSAIHCAGDDWDHLINASRTNTDEEMGFDEGSIMEKILLWHHKIMTNASGAGSMTNFDVRRHPNMLRQLVFSMMTKGEW